MRIPLSQELITTVAMILCGVLCGLVYDCIRFLRFVLGVSASSGVGKKHLHPNTFFQTNSFCQNLLVGIGDVFFFLIAAVFFCIWLYAFGSGIFRWFYLLSVGSAFFIYHLSVGRLVTFLLEVFWIIVLSLIRNVVQILLLPLVFLWKLIKNGLRRACLYWIHPWLLRLQIRRQKKYTAKIQKQIRKIIQLS